MDIKLRERISEIKKYCKPLTNFYSLDAADSIETFWECGSSFAFSYLDHGMHRLIYFATDKDVLAELIKHVPSGKFYLEFITNDCGEFSEELSRETLIYRMKRLANKDCSSIFNDSKIMQYEDDKAGIYPDVIEAHEINEVLRNIFSEENSHLLYDAEIEAAVRERQITIHRNDSGNIDSILKVVINPKKFYVNYVYNDGLRKNIHAMMISRLKEYHAAGGRYIYSWVADDNIASLKWHGKYGMEHDGVWDMIYRVER